MAESYTGPNLGPLAVQQPEEDTSSVATVSLNNLPVSPDNTISLAGDNPLPTNPPSPALQKKRADKFNFGLGDILDKPPADIEQAIGIGQEQSLRAQAATAMTAANQQAKQKALIDLANKQGRPLDFIQVRQILDPFNPANKPIDPDMSMEQAYATRYIGSVEDAADVMQDTVLDKAKEEIPDQVAPLLDKGSSLLQKMEYARTMQENLNDQVENQGWVPYLADQAKSLTQLYPELKLRGNVPEVGKVTGGIGLGSNLQAQADALLGLPVDEFKSRLSAIAGALAKDNPSLAKQFVDYVVGLPSINRVLDNTFTAIAPLDVATAAKGGVSLLRKVSVYNRANTAFKDIVRSSAAAGTDLPVRAAVAEGAGDVTTAGAIRAAHNITDPAPDMFKQVVEALPSNMRLDAELLGTNPGSLSREQLVRLQDGFANSANNILQIAAEAARVNRTPLPLALEDALKAYKQTLYDTFPGISNAILDFSPPIREPITNTYHVQVHIGNIGGDLFSSPEVAKNFADFHGFANAEIVEAKGRVQTEPAGYQGSKTDLATRERLEKSIPETEALAKKFQKDAKDKKLTPEARAEAKSHLTGENDIRVLLKRDKAALKDAYSRLTKTEPKIEQNGLGYKIVLTKPYDETSDVVRNYMIEKDAKGNLVGPGASLASNQSGFTTWKNAAIGWIRGADDTLALNDTVQRKVATYTQNLFRQWSKEEQKKIEAIATGLYKSDPVTGNNIPYWQAKPRAIFGKIQQRQVFKEFNQTLDYARKALDPVTGERGYFFKTPGELEDFYLREFRRSPSFPEVEAYFAHVKLTEGNRIFSEIAEFRNRARIGTEQHQVNVMDRGTKTILHSGYFDGIRQTTFPGGKDNILIMGARRGDETLHNLGGISIPPKELTRYKEGLQNGTYTLIRIYDPDSYPLRDFSAVAGAERIRYVLSPTIDTKPLDFNHVTRRGGGHFDYDYDHYIKQANIVPERAGTVGSDKRTKYNDLYTGDTTVMPIDNRAKGRDIAGRLDKVRLLLKDNKIDEAKDFATKNLPIEWKEVKSWFNPSRDPKGNVLPPRLSLNEPFYVVPKNKKIYDLDKTLEQRYPKTFRDGTREGSDAAQNQVAYNTRRDAHDVYTINGGRDSSLWKYEPAKLVDPIPTMNRALNRAINSTYMDDYKIYAVEHWLREAAPYLKATESEIRSSPFYHFETSDGKAAFKTGDLNRISNLLANRSKIKAFVGTPNMFDTWVHSLTQHIADAAYTHGGIAERAAIIPLWALNHIHDPVQLVRSFAFNAKLGVFALPQILVQMNTYANIYGIAGFKHAGGGTAGAFLHTWSRINRSEGFLNKLDEYANRMGFGKPGEWKEANKILADTGFEHVSGEYAMRDNVQHSFIKNDWGNFLDAGQVFFREGEKAVRLGAWYTAYREFRESFPTKVIGNAEKATILQRADVLTSNMSRASSSSLHGGIAGLTSQFLTYQLRNAELFLGKRLGDTLAERNMTRLRMLGVYSALYGMPVAFGVSGLPLGDAIRREAIDRGYVMGDNTIQSMVMEGLPSTLLAMATGGIDKGNHYNIGNRYGLQGFTQLWSDNPWWKMLGGAGVSIFANTLASASPLTLSIISGMRGDPKDMDHPFKVEDALDVFKEVSSINTTWQVLTAMNTGRWLSKNEAYQGDISTMNALFQGATGLHDQRQDDAFQIHNIKEAEKSYQDYTKQMVIKEIRRGLQDSEDLNQDQANEYMRRAFGRMEWSGMPLDMRAEVVAEAMKGNEAQADKVQQYFATSHVPTKKWFQSDVPATRMEQYKSNLRNEQ